MIARLTKVRSSHNNTGWEYRGYAPHPPVVGECFVLFYGVPNDSKFLRTSTVIKVQPRTRLGNPDKITEWEFETSNSTYELGLIPPSEVCPNVEEA